MLPEASMTRLARYLLGFAVMAALIISRTAGAQIFRGTVSDRTGAHASGAVVTLSRAADNDTIAGTDIRTVLADGRGAYTVGAPSPGRYRLIVRRIGSRPWRSDVLVIAASQTIQQDVVLEPLMPGNSSMALPEIRVTRATPCRTDAIDATRIASLWNDARTALLAAEASLGNGRATWLVRYSRQLDPRPERPHPVLSEVLQVFDRDDLGNARGFESISGDSLSAIGYWRRVNGMVTFHGPDARALLSEAFVRDHCFRLIDAVTEGRDSIGLFFQPIPARTQLDDPPEIRGAAWFDAATSRLMRVEFNWTRMPGNAPPVGLGGDLSFTWSADGAVYVDRWELRMPQTVIEDRELGFAIKKVTHLGVVEQGGVVFNDSSATSAGYGSLVGDLKIEGRRPLANAEVRVLGTPLRTQTDQAGKFFLDSVPAGLRVVVADHPSFSGYGLRAATQSVLLDDREARRLSLLAPGQEDIATSLCGSGAFSGGRSLLRIIVADSSTAEPLGSVRLRLMTRGAESPFAEQVTDADGVALFCSLPSNQWYEVTTPAGAVVLSEFRLDRNTLTLRQLWIQRP
jgi:hypothetical protein